VTLKYAPDGTPAWVVNTPVSSRGLGVKLSSDGGVFVVGESPQTVFRYPQSGSANQPPTAIASADTSAGPAPLIVNFSSAGSADPDGSIAGYAWSFGDGQTSTAANPSHSYVAGSYTARLTVTDNLGATTTSAPITITASAPPPTPTALNLASVKVAGGRSTTATVRVSSSVGVTVALASSNPSVASVPASVVVPAGATSATFTVKTSKVKRDTVVTLQASANGVTAAASLTVVR
jgi:PKD repeat protein